jgi:hypothetical protein
MTMLRTWRDTESPGRKHAMPELPRPTAEPSVRVAIRPEPAPGSLWQPTKQLLDALADMLLDVAARSGRQGTPAAADTGTTDTNRDNTTSITRSEPAGAVGSLPPCRSTPRGTPLEENEHVQTAPPRLPGRSPTCHPG